MNSFQFLLTIFALFNIFKEGSPIGNLDFLVTKVDKEIQSCSAKNVIKRFLPERHHEFEIEIDPEINGGDPYNDFYSVEWVESKKKIVIRGTTGVSALLGFNQYLKSECKCQIAWEGNQLKLPLELPKVNISKNVTDRFRYYQNVCTDSYSLVWLNWTQWEKHIDWIAINGINLPLAFTGQEMIWMRTYLSLGFTQQEIEDYITGPAYLAWWRMGNIQKWGGPMTPYFMKQKLILLHRILQRMRSLGMLPILPAFSGNVPPSLTKHYPNANVTQHGSWNGFNSSYSETFLLDPSDPLFLEIGKRFIHQMQAEFGTNNIYSVDTFNEMDPKNDSLDYLHGISKATYNSMAASDPKAIWLMQSWPFISSFWENERVEAYLTGVPVGNAIILDLQAEYVPFYKKFNNFYSQKFIFCMLHNFGGTLGLNGAFTKVNQGLELARQNSTIIGSGICPEGINQNYATYDFFFDSALNGPLNISDWVESFAERRYGLRNKHISAAWQTLKEGIYNSSGRYSKSLVTRRPSLVLTEIRWYKAEDPLIVLESFLNANGTYNSSSSALYTHDLVDFGRQFLQVLGSLIYKKTIKAYDDRNMESFEKSSSQFLAVLSDLEEILKTSPYFMLGNWVSQAESWAENSNQTALLRYNALNQISLWGPGLPDGEIADYASKQWAGMINYYYIPRWTAFFVWLNNSIGSGTPFKQKQFKDFLLKNIEIPFTFSQTEFPTKPSGDPLKEATRIFTKWKKLYTILAQEEAKNVTDENNEIELNFKRKRGRKGNKNRKNSKFLTFVEEIELYG